MSRIDRELLYYQKYARLRQEHDGLVVEHRMALEELRAREAAVAGVGQQVAEVQRQFDQLRAENTRLQTVISAQSGVERELGAERRRGQELSDRYISLRQDMQNKILDYQDQVQDLRQHSERLQQLVEEQRRQLQQGQQHGAAVASSSVATQCDATPRVPDEYQHYKAKIA